VVLDPVTVTKIWLLVKPYKRFKAWRQRRKGKRMAIDLGTRTSTNAVVGGGFLGVVYVNLVEILPWPQVVTALTTPEMVSLVSVLLAGVVARFSKTPAEPGKL
jgi:uncharacterized protein involved in cysteine biosynthesis